MKVTFDIITRDDAVEAINQCWAIHDALRLIQDPEAIDAIRAERAQAAEVAAVAAVANMEPEPEVMPAPAEAPKQKRGRKPKAATAVAAPANAADEQTDEPAVVVDAAEDAETARTRLRSLAMLKGVEWLRQMLAQQGAVKVIELTDVQVRSMLDDFDAAAA